DPGVHLPAHLTPTLEIVNPLQHHVEEPVQSVNERTGSPASGRLAGVLAVARGWAGSSCQALLLSGSHAGDEAVWVELEGRALSLSDVDLYAVLPDSRACRGAYPDGARARVAWARQQGGGVD